MWPSSVCVCANTLTHTHTHNILSSSVAPTIDLPRFIFVFAQPWCAHHAHSHQAGGSPISAAAAAAAAPEQLLCVYKCVRPVAFSLRVGHVCYSYFPLERVFCVASASQYDVMLLLFCLCLLRRSHFEWTRKKCAGNTWLHHRISLGCSDTICLTYFIEERAHQHMIKHTQDILCVILSIQLCCISL